MGVRTAPTINFGDGNPGVQSLGPFYNEDTDLCGDVFQQATFWKSMSNVDFTCRDTSLNGVADVGACVSWSNAALLAGSLSDLYCHDIYGAIQNTPSKCQCDSVDIQGLNVCLAAQLRCIGDDGQANTAPCRTAFSARVKVRTTCLFFLPAPLTSLIRRQVTASSTSNVFPKSAILYGNIFYDFRDIDQKVRAVLAASCLD